MSRAITTRRPRRIATPARGAGSLATFHLLRRCDVPRLPFRWTIDPYPGREVGFPLWTRGFEELPPAPFDEGIFAKQNVAGALRRDLHEIEPREPIAIGTFADPYPPVEERYGRTRAILEALCEWEGFAFSITTRSNLVTRDLDLLVNLAVRHRVAVNLTVTTLDRRRARALEPEAPRPDLRLKAVSELAAAGVPVGVLVAPVLPDITDDPRELDRLAAAAAGAGAGWIMANPLFLMPSRVAVFFPFLEEAFPDLVERYRQSYERSAFMPEDYARGLTDLVARLGVKHGLVAGPTRDGRPPAITGPQLSLF
ncbi:Rv2578c family radical SAM protein [soil metagenome]